MGPQSCCGITFHTGGSVRVTNCWMYPGIDPDSNEPGMPPTTQGEENQSPHNGHQRANTMHISSHFQELKMRPYTRPQLSKNVQNIARHN